MRTEMLPMLSRAHLEGEIYPLFSYSLRTQGNNGNKSRRSSLKLRGQRLCQGPRVLPDVSNVAGQRHSISPKL